MPVFVIETTHELVLTSSMAMIRPGDKSIYLTENGTANPVTSHVLHDRLGANARSMVAKEYKNAYAERVAINEKDADFRNSI